LLAVLGILEAVFDRI
jgi:hypothetical protein